MLDRIVNFFISSAYADTATQAPNPQAGGGMSFMVMFVIFFLFIYFAVWRPQSKRAKEQQNLLNSLAKGDEVVTTGGLLGRITKMTDHYVTLAIGSNDTAIVLQKASVVSVLPKGTLKSIE